MRCLEAAQISYPRTRASWELNREQLAKVWAEHHGVHAHTDGGGWLYTPTEQTLVQGWAGLADRLERRGVLKLGRGIDWTQDGTVAGRRGNAAWAAGS